MQIEKESTLNVYMYVQKGGGRKIGDKMRVRTKRMALSELRPK